MLAKNKILEGMRKGDIFISPFDISKLGPISYDMEIEDTICVYTKDIHGVLDTAKEHEPDAIYSLSGSEEGIILFPDNLYIAVTKETIYSKKYVPCVSGRSRFARLGLQVHQTSFFANPGHKFQWVLEISATVPVRIHKEDRLAQLYFEEITGELKDEDLYNGKFVDNNIQI